MDSVSPQKKTVMHIESIREFLQDNQVNPKNMEQHLSIKQVRRQIIVLVNSA